MPADYTAIQDSAVTLNSTNLVHTYPQFGAANVNNQRRPILACQVNPSGGNVSLEMTLNGTVVETVTFQSDEQRGWLEIVESGILLAAGNTLIISRTAGPGDITVSDVCMFYQVP
jgi:hypothetical protein